MSTNEPHPVSLITKARVSNIMAAATIATMLYGFVAGIPQTAAEGSIMGIIVGFAARHLWDSSQS